ncbi:Hypothetical predicted protein [Mytilus galloprovincialis]|uniref:Thiopurine S-methyltransferase n=1 Tax=Mytilus galloprovincialis TaxID=29158 RepID=A0A8B6FNI7_MYTGA|nr:Hypothetical predicted protein [Mytilus galloprovincialis]
MYRRSERKRTQTDRPNSGIASAAAKKAMHQHSDVVIKTNKSTKLWKEDKTIHTPKLCTMFTKHVDKMLNNREKIKIFVPHCGKAVEIKWLWDKGHEVFSSAIESGFGAVWDHSCSLIASDLAKQEKYVAIIKSLMGGKCVNLTVLDELSVNYDKIKTWFTDGFRVESRDYAKADKHLKSFGIKGHQLYTIFKI